jgi:LPS-assembly protein
MVVARVLAVLSLAAATTVLAQEPQSPPTPTPTPTPGLQTPSPPPDPSATPSIEGASALTWNPDVPTPTPTPTPTPVVPVDEAPLAPDELRIRANRQEGGEGKLTYEGFVDLRFGQSRIQADRLEMFEEKRPDGTTAQRIEATGNVVFMSGLERIAGESLRLDIDTGKGIFTKASGYLQPDVLFEAESIERIDADTYKLKGASFTACTQTNPRWMFKAGSATVDIDKKISATMVNMRVKGVPTPLLIPYFQFPINPEQRSTGLLMPRYGSSSGASAKGREIGLGFFWAMGRSMDQTFYYDWYTEYGIGLGHEFRFLRNAGSRGNFRSYFTRQEGVNKFDYDLDWSASQTLPARFKATLSANLYSSVTSRQELQDSIDYSSTRSRRAAVGLQGPISKAYLRLDVDANDVFFPDDSVQRRRRLPRLGISQSPTKIGKTGLAFSYDASAESLAQGDAQAGETIVLDQYSRIDAAPQLTRSFSLPFLQVSPKALVRFTRYSASYDEENTLAGPPVSRRYFEGSLEARGPRLFRLFRLPGDFYSDKFKHTIEPEFLYTFRSKVENFDTIPSFDFNDQYPGTNQIQYGLTNRIYAKRMGPAGKPVTHEFFNWRLTQTYYFDVTQNPAQFDPNYNSSQFNQGGVGVGPGPSHQSPIQSNLSIRPTLTSSVAFATEWNPNYKQFTSVSLTARVNMPRVSFNGSWARSVNLNVVAAQRTAFFNSIRGSGRFELWPERLTVDGSLTYDALNKALLQITTRVRYGIQCCGFAVERVKYNTTYRQDSKITFSLDLAGISSIGSFLGDNPSNQINAGRK